jgi:hypothetical protein
MKNNRNLYLQLPDDPEDAFAELHYILIDELEKALSTSENSSDFFERRYIDQMIAFDQVHGLDFLSDWQASPSRGSDFYEYFNNFKRFVEIQCHKIQMEAARRVKSGATEIVILDSSIRSAIHKLVDVIREKLNGIELPENKRDSLFNKLNAFTAELDRDRTRPEAFFAFVIEMSRTAKKSHDELKPFEDTINRIVEMLDKAQKLRDSLPPWSERKKLPRSSELLASPKSGGDDEIPF